MCRLTVFLVLPGAPVTLNTFRLPFHRSPALPRWLLGSGQPWQGLAQTLPAPVEINSGPALSSAHSL